MKINLDLSKEELDLLIEDMDYLSEVYHDAAEEYIDNSEKTKEEFYEELSKELTHIKNLNNDFKYPRVGVGLCIVRDGKVLLHKRKGKHASGEWAFPGGHLELWEGFEHAAVRELREEAGPEIECSKPKFWYTANTKFYSEGKQYVVVFLKCDWISGEAILMEPDKNEGWDWFDWNNLPTPLIEGIAILKRDGLEL